MFLIPKIYQEAWNHPCPYQRKQWRDAITKEMLKMMTCKVWTKMKRSNMEQGRLCIKCKWVFNIKRDGTFRARLVACGCLQKPGVDFQESYSPVINYVAWRTVIVCQIIWGLKAILMDVEVAFLNGDLDEVIYMECPDGVVRQNAPQV
jgi:Reverse transcriptase (RNA-dependent DNA polymerase)